MVFKDGKVLLGKRKGEHAPGVWGGPGGHLEHMESFEDCAKREAHEETGIEIENVQFLCITNLTSYPPRHYVDIGLRADWKSGKVKVCEPEKCEAWRWCSLDNLPSPLFDVVKNYIEAYKTGRNYFDA